MNSFDSSYYGKPPWDINRPQLAFVNIAKDYSDLGHILDIGCGTGEHAIFFSTLGYKLTGIDSSPKAIELAKEKAKKKNIEIDFFIKDALDLTGFEQKFNTIIDSGVFHIFSDTDRVLLIQNFHKVLKKDGRLFILCFSDREPPGYGPRRITKEEIIKSFENGWDIEDIEETIFETNFLNGFSIAWLIKLKKSNE
jgi:SAM-dependent methyltransferase